jgi:ureidoglycolate lyase
VSDGGRLAVEPLTAAAFAAFGEVIDADPARALSINAGTALRYDDLATIDVGDSGGRPRLSLFRAQPRSLPLSIRMLERHRFGSQAFLPLDPALRYLVVVADDPAATPRVFLAAGGQGVNYRRGCWHHPLLALDRVSDFAVIDRGGSVDCDEAELGGCWHIERA